MRFKVQVVLVLCFALASFGAPAALAHPLSHGEAPRVVNPRPATGEVVSAGRVDIAALAIADGEITEYRVAVDGEEQSASSSGGDHATIRSSVRLDPGWHTIDVWASSAAGEAHRRWRIRVTELVVDRVAGQTRVATAVAVSQQLHATPLSAQAAVLARADDYPDALAGGPLAHDAGGPLLLTGTDALAEETAEELRRVLPPGSTVYLLGGPGALSEQVAKSVADEGFRPERVAGATRFDTAAEIARRLPAAEAAIVASGEAFADALAGSSVAAERGWPILLTARDALPSATSAVLTERGVRSVTVLGGGAAVSGQVEESIRALDSVEQVGRLAGSTRFETARAVADHYFPRAETVTVASGERFPDALAGGAHAASLGAPVLLTAAAALPGVAAELVASSTPQTVVVYGGEGAVGGGVVSDLRAASVSGGGPALVESRPTGPAESLEEVVLTFDRDLDVAASSVYVSIAGNEVAGQLTTGDFPRTLVLTVSELPEGIEREVTYPVRVVVAATAGEATRHVERRFDLRQPPRTLSTGDRGPEVTDLQRRLQSSRYWAGPADGVYGTLTAQAVMALQKVAGLTPDGIYTAETRQVLEAGPPLPSPRSTSGFTYEVDLARRVLMVVRDGQVAWVFNTSAGHGRVYQFQGSTYRANTTTGRHRVTRQIDGMREAERGKLWRPKYYDTSRGIAIHGSTSVPAHHASSGCIRLTYAAMDFLWSIDPSTGANVWVYPENHYG